jgi:hypothetical protein
VKSIADFTNIIYLLSFDKKIVIDSLRNLKISNPEIFMDGTSLQANYSDIHVFYAITIGFMLFGVFSTIYQLKKIKWRFFLNG